MLTDRNQEVTLTTVEPHQRLRIVGITPDHGLLRCVPISSGSNLYGRDVDGGYDDRTYSASAAASSQYVELQPDGNSFDLMAGMIKRKA